MAEVKTKDTCPSCNGTGSIQAAILVTDSIESSIKYLSKGEGHKKMSLLLHPILEAYLVKGEIHNMLKGIWGSSIRTKWEKKYGIEIAIESNSSVEILEFQRIIVLEK